MDVGRNEEENECDASCRDAEERQSSRYSSSLSEELVNPRKCDFAMISFIWASQWNGC